MTTFKSSRRITLMCDDGANDIGTLKHTSSSIPHVRAERQEWRFLWFKLLGTTLDLPKPTLNTIRFSAVSTFVDNSFGVDVAKELKKNMLSV
nr:hypothetical protein [Tanacetum cinerariifolium]